MSNKKFLSYFDQVRVKKKHPRYWPVEKKVFQSEREREGGGGCCGGGCVLLKRRTTLSVKRIFPGQIFMKMTFNGTLAQNVKEKLLTIGH